MRNLKKVLALVLALVMSLSLVTIANAADFSDNADIDYSEAVDVMVAAGIIDGVGNNSFDPNGTLTREQAAKLITYMLLGENSEKLGVEGTSFNDVAATRWSAPAIEYCAAMGIIDGAGDGNFYPAGKLTGYAFAKMLLTAIGYKSDREGFTGDSWTINVATKALSEDVRLNRGLEKMSGSAEISRQEAAQMALNAIKAPLVYYPNKGNSITVGGTVVDFSSQQAEYVTTTLAKEQRISTRTLTNTREYTVEFGEKYLPKLVLKGANDAFGRPSYTWLYDKKEIGTYLDDTNLVGEFTAKVTGRDLYDLITKATLDDSNVTVYVDGETEKTVLGDAYFAKGNIIKSNTEAVGSTDNGVLTQVFVDTDVDNHSEITIAIINTYLAKASADYNSKKDEVTFNVWSVEEVTSAKKLVKNADPVSRTSGRTKAIKVSGEDFAIEDVKQDDIVLVTVADKTIQTITPIEVVSNVSISAFKDGSWVKVDGTQYDYASTAQYDIEVLDEYSQTNMKDTTYNVYLDPYGYAIGVEIVEGETNYAFLTGIDLSTSNLTNKTAEGNIITLDGDIQTVKINMDKSRNAQDKKFTSGDNDPDGNGTGVSSLMNTWCTYSVDKNGTYTLTEIPNDAVNFGTGDKAGQGRNYDSTTTASNAWSTLNTTYDGLSGSALEAARDVVTIDKKHVTLDGIAGSSVRKAYGNDATIFLSAETDMIVATTALEAADKNAVVISGVSGISTGVRNTSLTAWSARGVLGENPTYDAVTATLMGNVSQGVYTLFNNKGYVIAAIVVGEDGGASSNYVYVTSEKASQEGYSSADDEWTWTREVILNGQVTEITEKGDSLFEIGHKSGEGNMTRDNVDYGSDTGDWYKVTYKADGTVHEVEGLTFANKGNPGKFIKDITDVEDSVDAHDTVILFANYTTKKNIVTVEGNTLHVETAGTQTEHEGFAVAEDAKIALIQDTQPTKNSIKIMENIYEYDNGTKGLEQAVIEMNDNENFKGYISAVFENGLATSIVIYDKTPTDVDQGSVNVSDVVVTEFPEGTLNVTSLETLNAREVAAAIRDFLNDDDIEKVVYDSTSSKKATVTYADGSEVVYDVKRVGNAAPSEIAGAELVADIQKQIGETSTTGAEVEIVGNTIITKPADDNACDAYVTLGSDGTSDAVKDLVGFLVKLHGNDVAEIEFNGSTYVWNDDVRYASKWIKQGVTPDGSGNVSGTGNTLANAIEQSLTAQITALGGGSGRISVTIIVDGDAEMVVAIDWIGA